MSYEKQFWQTYDELKTEEENKALGAVVTSERMNYVENGIESSHKSIDNHIKQLNNPHKVTSEQVGAYSKEEANKTFAAVGSSCTKKEINDNFLKKTDAAALYANKENVYTKDEVCEILETKNNSKNVYTKQETDDLYQKITKKDPLWTGAWYGSDVGNGTFPSKSLSQCENGWIFQFQEYTKDGTLNGACYHYFFVPKQHVHNPGSGGVVFMLHGYYDNFIKKYLYIKDEKITGSPMNAPDSDKPGTGNKAFALSAIYEG